ncbi:hypothetical protein FQN53_007193 [Emmonsiellopsis sp. PD_33]|nr:hypothetical protein FQN53_007193 [Emmonsiellopsis sp. PD_33]
MFPQPPLAQSPAPPSRPIRGSLPNDRLKNTQSSFRGIAMAHPEYTGNFNAMNSKPTSPLSTISNNDILPRLHTSTTINRSPFTDPIDANLTPSTPLSGFSPHDYTPFPFSRSPAKTSLTSDIHAHPKTAEIGPTTSLDSARVMVSKTPNGSPSKAKTATELTQGQKRTASGEMKSTVSSAHFQSPRPVMANHHSRTLSTDSTGSRIAELSAQLRSRLSYAASKVEKDWHSHNLEKIHAIPPILGYSPPSQASLSMGFKSPSRSPKGTPKHVRARHSISITPTTNGSSNHRNTNFPPNPTSISSINGRAGRTQSASPNGKDGTYLPPASIANNKHPRLAPPADIVSGNGNTTRRRPNPNDALLQNAYTNRNYSPRDQPDGQPSASSTQTNGTTTSLPIPDTPPQFQTQSSYQSLTPSTNVPPIPKLRTPSQNALMEKDAIETLLFMSSPENSGYHPNSQNSQRNGSHLAPPAPISGPGPARHNSTIDNRLGLGIQHSQAPSTSRPARKVSFADDESNGSHETYLRNGNMSTVREHEAGDEIDRMLDELNDSDDEIDGAWLAHFNSQYDKEITGFNR